jgi:hypothetical protein
MMYLHREDLKLIGEIMEHFPGVDTFRLESENSSGIGSILSLIVVTQVGGRDAEVKFEISGVENW